MQNYLICLEGHKKDNELGSESAFIRKLWSSSEANVEFCDCCGNKAMTHRLMRELSKSCYDAVYLNYDLLNTYVSNSCFAVFNELREYCETLAVPCFMFISPSFESLLLKSEVFVDLIECIKTNNSLSDRSLLAETLNMYLKYIEIGDYPSLAVYKTSNPSFNRVWLADVNAEKSISSLVSQITSKHSRLWHCSKGEIGNCWLKACEAIQIQDYACKKYLHPEEFSTCLCDYMKVPAILKSLSVNSVEELYEPFNNAAKDKVLTTHHNSKFCEPTHIFS